MVCKCNQQTVSRRNSITSNKKTNLNDGWNVLSEYAGSSTIHGLRYLTEPKRPLAERVWWIIAFTVSLYCCGNLIMNIWTRWDENPVIIGFSDKPTPVWSIPFPAITICPQTKASSEVLNFTAKYHIIDNYYNKPSFNMSEHDLERMKAIYHICEPDLIELEALSQEFTGKECVQHLRDIAPTFDSVFYMCIWKNEAMRCSDLFTEIITNVGVCYTFNMLKAEELFRQTDIQKEYKYFNHTNSSTKWSLETGYLSDAPFAPYPNRVLSSHIRDSLELYLKISTFDMDYICGGPIQGFKLMFHAPNDMPWFKKNFHHALLDQEAVFTLTPKVTTTSKRLKNYNPIKRQCYYNKERYLRFFEFYTQDNCKLECLSNYTLKTCKCVKFSMPNAPGTPLCGSNKISCYLKAEYELATIQQKHLLLKDAPVDEHVDCDCLPACTSIIYDTEISQFDLDWNKLLKAVEINITGIKLARTSISFKHTQLVASKRSELYGLTDFISNSGGLLGLFMGVSLLSIVEIIYFCTIRIFSNICMKRHSIVDSTKDDVT